MPQKLRCIALFICASVYGYAAQRFSAAALTPADQLPLKYTALFGSEASIGAIAVDAEGSAYIAGTANSALPATTGAFQTDYKPGVCTSHFPNSPPQTYPFPVAFAAKLNHDGTALVYLTYLGASNSSAQFISVDAQGNAWIAGTVDSADLPATPGALQTTMKGPQSAFVLKLNPAGSQVLFATYLGGSGDLNVPASLAVDATGSVYVAGYANSADFPITPGAFQTDAGQNVAGPNASFITKFDSNGKPGYSTYFHGGNSSGTNISSIAADAAGNVYFTGSHRGGSLPTTPGAFQTSAGGQDAAFAAKLDAIGSKLVYSTYLAANSQVDGNAIAIDSQGDAYVAGGIQENTPDLPSSFPVTPGAFQTTAPNFAIQDDVQSSFIAKLNATGSALVYSTFLYASGSTWIGSMAVDPSGSVVAIGETYALDFPTTPGALRQCDPNGAWGSTGFLFKLASDGSAPVYSTYLGADALSAVQLDSAGDVYISGSYAGTLPLVPGSFGWTSSGPFVAKLALVPLPVGSVSCVANAASHGGMAIAPGEIVDIFGNGIGPARTVSASASTGHFDTSLGGVEVLFNGVFAPVLLAGPNRIRAVVPFETNSSAPGLSASATIQIVSDSATVQPVTAPVAALSAEFGEEPRAPGVNRDDIRDRAEQYATPARNGSDRNSGGSTRGAGAGHTNAGIQVGSASFGEGEITYAGAAPGFVAGLAQINFRIPISIFHGFSGLYLQQPASSAVSQVGVYFYLQ